MGPRDGLNGVKRKFVTLPGLSIYLSFFYLVCEAIGTAATPGLLCQPQVIVKMDCGEADGM
jgi:hypothetical protein